MAPFEIPVVPPVYWRTAKSSKGFICANLSNEGSSSELELRRFTRFKVLFLLTVLIFPTGPASAFFIGGRKSVAKFQSHILIATVCSCISQTLERSRFHHRYYSK